MVSIWPWRRDDTSPASFEKTLSSLSAKISGSQVQLEQLRQRSRRFKALWTLYTSVSYLICVIILAFVVGWKNWGTWEYSAIAGSPLLVYLVRRAITAYYAYRTEVVTHRLEEQKAERTKTIDKLKAATKYNSTQQLLEKYGEAPLKPKRSTSPAGTPRKSPKQPQRTSLGPPPTANIPQNRVVQPAPPPTQQSPSVAQLNQNPPSILNSPASSSEPGPPEFAPNAFATMPQYDRSDETNVQGKWYDRILDLLLGDDETSPRSRIVLICKNCRLVNGQAPPGIKRMEEIGRWRCIGCGGWNGEVAEGEKIVEEIKKMAEINSRTQGGEAQGKNEKEITPEDEGRDRDPRLLDNDDNVEIEKGGDADEGPARRTRSGRRKAAGEVET